ncbi:hypothetical protein LEP1GSC116_1413 [Leptospira interrogans serovar Icterohaemorrhagiae str. Verdun HP]|uniref:Uncharacterized protein n=5 Tax=Leptospira interrogans TaxID=173 RepID=M6ZN40_LEPIR|nr:hypothetical protein LEP1GSC150_5194 [Leptospira interrogans serovar Copenhageni str. LT2050]EMM93438.1 hypothetical protein LEP1GSC158_4775 [Leptospira interrogans serovar Zanoni str. LT2156]EMN28479.1 hypothetical protein LEP1GSC083_4086 [Leptospira interrogans serovar Pyrogenes str. L0374]EMO06828.1 hypothetical protein LEP1GSC116_1413 [Leptospira interrogans serovar Icterohaemorrhagiae str. Verdun HP]EMP05597.1 hypothetical protein LEP1GSC124_2612 [Leptospira interrogans serovar Pyrogene
MIVKIWNEDSDPICIKRKFFCSLQKINLIFVFNFLLNGLEMDFVLGDVCVLYRGCLKDDS